MKEASNQKMLHHVLVLKFYFAFNRVIRITKSRKKNFNDFFFLEFLGTLTTVDDAPGHYGHREKNRFKIGPKLRILCPKYAPMEMSNRPFCFRVEKLPKITKRAVPNKVVQGGILTKIK